MVPRGDWSSAATHQGAPHAGGEARVVSFPALWEPGQADTLILDLRPWTETMNVCGLSHPPCAPLLWQP